MSNWLKDLPADIRFRTMATRKKPRVGAWGGKVHAPQVMYAIIVSYRRQLFIVTSSSGVYAPCSDGLLGSTPKLTNQISVGTVQPYRSRQSQSLTSIQIQCRRPQREKPQKSHYVLSNLTPVQESGIQHQALRTSKNIKSVHPGTKSLPRPRAEGTHAECGTPCSLSHPQTRQEDFCGTFRHNLWWNFPNATGDAPNTPRSA